MSGKRVRPGTTHGMSWLAVSVRYFGCLLTVIATLMLAALYFAPPLLANVSATSQANAGEGAGLQRSEAPLRGLGTWYDAPSRTDAAAGPALRDMLGPDWRGSWVTVTSGRRSTKVRLTDWCRCPGDRVIDLDDAAFAELAPLSRGVVRVTVERLGDIALPETDTE